MPTPPVIALYGANQPDVALLNQVEQCQTTPYIAFGNAYHQSQVRQDELLHGLTVAHFDALGKFNFPLVCNHRHTANFPQVGHHRI